MEHALARPLRTTPAQAARVRSYAAKAQEFAAAATGDLEAGRNIAATSLAIHAGINATDAVCGAGLGTRAAGEDHDQVNPSSRRSPLRTLVDLLTRDR